MIPRIIHYCWFGHNPLPDMAKKCIASWKKYCPDYDIKEWNESNFDVNCCAYVKEAYEAKKWAFVSDYARFKILYEQGGVYFDTDVELIRPLDEILTKGGFMGIEKHEKTVAVNPGLGLAVAPGTGIYYELMNAYHERHFKNEDGSLNLKTVVEYTTECLRKHGLKDENQIQEVAGIYVYPKEYFNPCDMDTGKIIITDKTVSIHHYAASWVDDYSRFRGKVYHRICRILGKKNAECIRKLVGRKLCR